MILFNPAGDKISIQASVACDDPDDCCDEGTVRAELFEPDLFLSAADFFVEALEALRSNPTPGRACWKHVRPMVYTTDVLELFALIPDIFTAEVNESDGATKSVTITGPTLPQYPVITTNRGEAA